MKFFSRSSRATGPKMRVPRGLRWLSMITAAFSSNAICVPSSRPEGLRVRLHGVDLDDDRLVHRVGNDDAAALLAPSALVLGLLEPDDRLANRRPLARRLRALPPLASRDVLARTLPLGLLGRSGRRLCL